MWIAIVGGALGFVAALIVVKILINRARKQTRDRLTAIANGRSERKLSGARSFGLKSKGTAQVRGNGALALFDDELVFVQLIPATEIRVPRKAITAVGTISAFNGKSAGAELLLVEWTLDDRSDAAAWQLHGDVRGWVEALEGDAARG